MPYESTVYRILIASPSDVDEEREVASRIIQDWNDLYSFNKKIVLLPVKWETHSSPTYGIRPQEAINKQIVDDCDMLIGFFWTKIGSPTGENISGTVEEIKRVSESGKPVLLYFSKRGKDPSTIDINQLNQLNDFKKNIYQSALVENFNSIVEFRDKVSRQIEMKIRELQERKENNQELIRFSFINQENGELLNNDITITVNKIIVDQSEVDNLFKMNGFDKKKELIFKKNLLTFIKVSNTIPILLGIQNASSRTFSNAIVDLKIMTSTKDSIDVNSSSTGGDDYYYSLHNLNISRENRDNIFRLFNNNLSKINSNNWELSTKSFSLVPGKIKIIDSVITINHIKNTKVTFNINLYSDNILQPISSSCVINIKTLERSITSVELGQILVQVEEDEDLPF